LADRRVARKIIDVWLIARIFFWLIDRILIAGALGEFSRRREDLNRIIVLLCSLEKIIFSLIAYCSPRGCLNHVISAGKTIHHHGVS